MWLGVLIWMVQLGCAARGPRVRPPLPGPTSDGGISVTPHESAEPTPPKDETSNQGSVSPRALPGSGRIYPSEEEANHAPAGAAEAFPVPSGVSAMGVVERRGDQPGSPGVNDQPVPEGYQPMRSRTANRAATRFTVQLVALSSLEAAEERRKDLAPYFSAVLALIENGGLYKLRFEPTGVRTEAEGWLETAHEMGFDDAFLVPLEEGSP